MDLATGYRCQVYPLLLVAASVGLSNFAAAIGIGTAGVDPRTRLRVGLVFGLFETGMPVVGLLIGAHFAARLGSSGRWIGAGLLIAVGGYSLALSISQARAGSRRSGGQRGVGGQQATASRQRPGPPGGLRLLLTGFALSIDNLIVGFALGTYQIPVLAGAAVIGGVSVALSLLGLELGARIGRLTGERGEQLGGVILISVGILVATGQLG